MRLLKLLMLLASANADARVGTAERGVLTPERMLSAPRPGSSVASPSGMLAVVGTSTYDADSETTKKALHLVHVPASSHDDVGPIQTIVHNTTAGFFLSNSEVVYVLENAETSEQHLFYKDISRFSGGNLADAGASDAGIHIGTFPAPVENIKAVHSSDASSATLVFSATVYDVDGDLSKVREHDESPEEELWQEVKVYDNAMVRHWDRFVSPHKRSQLFSVELKRDQENKWAFASEFRNLLRGTKLEAPIPPFGGADDFHVSAEWVVWTSKDLDLPNAWHTKTNIYVAPLKGGAAPVELSSGTHGAISSPVFNRDGTQLAWLQMAIDGFESDRRQIVLYNLSFNEARDLKKGRQNFVLPGWDRSPTKLHFSYDGKKLLALAEEEEHEKVFEIELSDTEGEPSVLIDAVGVSSLQVLPGGRFLVTGSTLQSLPEVYVQEHGSDGEHSPLKGKQRQPSGPHLRKLTHFNDALADVEFGPKPQQFSYSGANGRPAYGWIHFPAGFDASKARKHSYALKVLIHGGPEGCWSNSWSTRWNPEVFAASTPEGDAAGQGSIVITLDPAGSTSFGQAYQEEILNNWGGSPYQDIIAGVQYILNVYDQIDPERIVAAGASYGGYMINWLQGHNHNGLFKGLVNHDGVFSTLDTFFSTDELYFPEHEYSGTPWEQREAYERWNPVNHLANWNTPMLVVHGAKDYRLTEAQGLSAFNVLQRRGVPSRFLHFAEENHWVRNPRNSRIWHSEVLGWLNQWAGKNSAAVKGDKPADALVYEQAQQLVIQQ
ncbi:hypothetical protein K437DRAFT_238726 [Tilletiaria anomala UBC 951]|uniref:Dipeptidyl-peptidase V n=1 Tax=Tilletiaria anomala (strain ATCC 24038 / CBS 436.72 / UBC 951) TaxID=1037660 RepID=A0A066VK46_TILAU|nr:uncharacterized protein K437DRAFT_238726 [Tilletiaria anomala UBC 951]KDN40688.1 hypothetical protein K437DRAFT_238726 [Tilletiaria anomala UBC 951]